MSPKVLKRTLKYPEFQIITQNLWSISAEQMQILKKKQSSTVSTFSNIQNRPQGRIPP